MSRKNDKNDRNDKNDTGRVSSEVYGNLPPTLRDITKNLDQHHERDVVLTALLPVFAGALHNTRFKYGGMWNGLNLYTAAVAPAGMGKGKMKHAKKVGDPLNKRLHDRSEKRLEQWEDRKQSENQEAGPRPAWERLYLPADSSAASLKKALAASPSGVIFETEFKTLSNVLEQDWGQFRDVLLKGFQNEPVEVGREKLERPQMIEHPAPSMAVSGTPGTFSEVISDTEDGLFSRFAFYKFEGEATWMDQFGDVEGDALDAALESAADRIEAMYREQEKREEPLYLTFSEQAMRSLNQACSFITEHWKRRGVRPELHSSLRRAAVRALRIAGIMRLLRHHENGNGLYAPKRIEVGMDSMRVGLRLAFTYLVHALRIAEEFGVKDERQDLRRDQIKFLETLPDGQFETKEAKEIAEEVGVNPRTAQRWLKKWGKDTGLIEKVDFGTWRKVTPDRNSERVPGVIPVISVIPVILDSEMGPIGEIPEGHGDGVPENSPASGGEVAQ
jgi:hypothetical protein